jgi:hypothetical protein
VTDAQTLIASHTRAELDQIAAEAGIEGAATLPSKQEVAQAIAALDEAADEQEQEQEQQATLGPDWALVQDGPAYFIAERFVTPALLGSQQKLTEGAETLEQLVSLCDAIDAHQGGLPASNVPVPV